MEDFGLPAPCSPLPAHKPALDSLSGKLVYLDLPYGVALSWVVYGAASGVVHE
jgi:hypothetical protein